MTIDDFTRHYERARQFAGHVIAFGDLPFAGNHDTVYRQRESGKHQRIKNGFFVMARKHRTLIIHS